MLGVPYTEQPVGASVVAGIAAASDSGGPLGMALTFLNSGAVELWADFQLRLAQQQRLDALLDRTLVVSWDTAAHAACLRHERTKCAMDDHALPPHQQRTGMAAAPRSWDDFGRQRFIYCRLMWRRLEVLATAVGLGSDVLLIDVDILLFGDPLCLPLESASRTSGLPDPLQTGAPADIYPSVWARPTNRTCPYAGCAPRL